MRIKAFYSANEIVTDLYTTGQQWMTVDNEEYIGLYHKYSTGEVYTQPKWNPEKSKKLIKYKVLDPAIIEYNKITTIKLNYESFKTHNIKITRQNINDGFIDRFILKKINENRFYEVDKKTYESYSIKKIDPSLYVGVKVKWTIAGPLQTTTKGTVTIAGVRDTNIAEIERAEKQLPGLSIFLNDPLQYYTDNDFISPSDINGLDS